MCVFLLLFCVCVFKRSYAESIENIRKNLRKPLRKLRKPKEGSGQVKRRGHTEKLKDTFKTVVSCFLWGTSFVVVVVFSKPL